jgi:hypothetical protein
MAPSPNEIVVKIAFVLDCTGSMEPWIHEAKTKINEIIESNRELHPNAHFEVALVAYRDYGDTVRRRVVDFSSPNQIVQALRSIHAEGGDDEAEDIAGALDRALALTWGPSDVRMLFHIADAPAHGNAYHEPRVSDRYPEGDPDGNDPRRLLRHLADMEVEYTFVRITSSTDKMIDVFHEVYTRNEGRFRVIDLHPQSYNGRYGPRRGNMAELLSPAVTQIVDEAVTRHSASQDR